MEVSQILKTELGLPGGSVVKNLPANAEDMGLIPDLQRFHVSWSSWASVPQLLSLCSRAQEPQLLKPRLPKEFVLCNRRSHLNEMPSHCNCRVAPVHHS